MPYDGAPTALDRARHSSSYFTNGFLPQRPAASRLPDEWKLWEDLLAEAVCKLGRNTPLTLKGIPASAEWRASIELMPKLPTVALQLDVTKLLRARQVLTFLLHFYIHSLPKTTSPIHIPPPLSVPLYDVSRSVGLPPICTYADTIYYNYSYLEQQEYPDNVQIHCAFTSTPDEAHFYRTQVLIEHCGADAMRVMRRVIDEVSAPSTAAVSLVAQHLDDLTAIIDDINGILNAVRKACDPAVFFNEVRVWLPGAKLIFDGTFEGEEEVHEWAGSSAAQSTTIQALDAFLGIDELTHNPSVEVKVQTDGKAVGYLARMRAYIPADHRVVLDSLSEFGRSLRSFIIRNSSSEAPSNVLIAYNSVINSLKTFRTSHIRIATMYIVNQRKDVKSVGTGGTELVPFLKSVRDQTARGTVQ